MIISFLIIFLIIVSKLLFWLSTISAVLLTIGLCIKKWYYKEKLSKSVIIILISLIIIVVISFFIGYIFERTELGKNLIDLSNTILNTNSLLDNYLKK